MFVVFEGIDGSGKTSVQKAVADILGCTGQPIVATSEFAAEYPWTAAFKSQLLSAAGDPRAEYEVVLQARAKHSREKLRNLDSQTVLMDRYVLSTIGYQCNDHLAGGDAPTVIEVLNDHVACGWPVPDLTLYLSVPYHIARDRLRRRGGSDAFDQRGPDFFMSANNIMRSFIETRQRQQPHMYRVIDANRLLEEVVEDAVGHITAMQGAAIV